LIIAHRKKEFKPTHKKNRMDRIRKRDEQDKKIWRFRVYGGKPQKMLDLGYE